MIVTGSITNRFGPSSAIMDWSLSLVFPDGHAVKGVVPLWNHEDFHLFTAAAPERELILNAKDYWPIKESNSPIPAGGVRCGWFWAVFQDTAQSTLSEVHPRVVLGFGDAINRRRHEISLVADYKLGDPIALDDLRNR